MGAHSAPRRMSTHPLPNAPTARNALATARFRNPQPPCPQGTERDDPACAVRRVYYGTLAGLVKALRDAKAAGAGRSATLADYARRRAKTRLYRRLPQTVVGERAVSLLHADGVVRGLGAGFAGVTGSDSAVNRRGAAPVFARQSPTTRAKAL